MTFAREAWPFVLPFALLAVGLGLTGRYPAAAAALVVAIAVLLFFRIPNRRFEGGIAAVLAAADGRITLVAETQAQELGPGRYHHVVTFLSVFNVHVQRAPVSGEVIESRYTPGRKVAAFRADAGDVNENHLTVIRRDNGDLIGMRQVAGLLARRVVAYPKIGDRIERGQIIGLIKFGSRVDLFFPYTYHNLAARGQRVETGLTVIGETPAEP